MIGQYFVKRILGCRDQQELRKPGTISSHITTLIYFIHKISQTLSAFAASVFIYGFKCKKITHYSDVLYLYILLFYRFHDNAFL